MDGEVSSGEYELPNGEVVRVYRAEAGWWTCVVVEADGHAVTVQRVTPVLWAQLQRRRLRRV